VAGDLQVIMKTKREFLKQCQSFAERLVHPASRGARAGAELVGEGQPWRVRIVVRSAASLTADVIERLQHRGARLDAFMAEFPADTFATIEPGVEKIDDERSAIEVAFFFPPYEGAARAR